MRYISQRRGLRFVRQWPDDQPMAIPDGPLIPYAQGVKEAVGTFGDRRGKLRSPEMGDGLIRDGKADFGVAIGRSLLADPEWPNKAREGRLRRSTPASPATRMHLAPLFPSGTSGVTVQSGHRARAPDSPRPAPATKKRVLIAGGGLSRHGGR